jgi:hypothetical protein
LTKRSDHLPIQAPLSYPDQTQNPEFRAHSRSDNIDDVMPAGLRKRVFWLVRARVA